jgi:two-component system NtrC family response regulator
MKPKLLIVDDDQVIRSQMKWGLNEEYEVLLAEDRASALAAFREHHPLVVLLDLGLPPQPGTPDEGLAALAEMLIQNAFVKVIIISGQDEKSNALRAIGEGAYDFLTKPVPPEELKVVLKRTFHVAQLERDYRELQRGPAAEGFEEMLGVGQPMQQVFASVRKVATTDAPVLILGESGTGKEMVATAIHRRGARKEGPFIAINCSAIPETLLESELFGHEKGSFTGAHVQRKGRIECAAGGTLFLDEIGELPAAIQVKLLRFLQDQRLVRVGGREEISVDTRITAATNANLNQAIVDGRFREDLYYRLAVVVINLPPLRDRDMDVHLLAQAFLQRAAAHNGKNGLAFSEGALRVLLEHSWPGNVRELENRVKRAVIMAEGRRLTAKDLGLAGAVTVAHGTTLKDAREAVERELVQRALRKHGGRITAAAAELGVSRPALYDLMEKLGMREGTVKGD